MVNRDLQFYMENIHEEEFFQRFTNDEINTLRDRSFIHQYQKGQVLFFQEDPKQYFYYLFKGLIKLEKMDETGEYAYIDYISEDTFFPYGEVMSGKNYYYTGYAQTDIDLMIIPKQVLEDILTKNSLQLIYMYEQITKVLIYLEKRIQMTTISNAKTKVIHTLAIWMADLSVERGDVRVIKYPMTISELGLIAGTTRETASRVVKKLVDEKRIQITRQSIHYLDVPYFQKILDQ